MRLGRCFGVLALVFCAGSGPAWAQYKETRVGQVGPFTIHKIDEGGKFDRCAATLKQGPGMLRLAWNLQRVYTISVPAVAPVPGQPLLLTIDMGKAGSWSQPAATNGERTWAALTTPTVEKMFEVRQKLVVTAGARRFEWPIGTVPLVDVFASVEDCRNQYGR